MLLLWYYKTFMKPWVSCQISSSLSCCHLAGGLVYSFGELLWRHVSVPVSAPVLEGSLLGKTVVHVAAGGFHCGALSEQGNIFMWGENTAGQCGLTEKGAAANITGWSTPFFFPLFLCLSVCPTHYLPSLCFPSQCASIHSYNPLLRNVVFLFSYLYIWWIN